MKRTCESVHTLAMHPVLNASSFSLEVNGTLLGFTGAYDDVEEWSAPTKSPFSLLLFTLFPVTRKELKGVVLIISPFNIPFFLSLTPLVHAFRAEWAFLF